MKRSSQLQRRTTSTHAEARAATTRRLGARICEQCGKSFFIARDNGHSGSRRYCSKSCQWQAAHRQIDLRCDGCGKTFQRVAAWVRKRGKHVYCTAACSRAARVIPESEHSRGRHWLRIAETIRERDQHQCVRCGSPQKGSRRFPVDHVIPWRLVRHHEERANDSVNLATLCHSCHGKKLAVERAMTRGDWLALRRFYGDARALAAMAFAEIANG